MMGLRLEMVRMCQMDRIGSNGRSEKFENAADADKRTSSATATADAPLTVCSPSVLVRD